MSRHPTTIRYRGHTIDLVAIGRHYAGTWPLPSLSEPEQEYAARILTRAGLGAFTIADRLGISPRTVTRWRAEWTEEDQ